MLSGQQFACARPAHIAQYAMQYTSIFSLVLALANALVAIATGH